jgi:hypothetical protein
MLFVGIPMTLVLFKNWNVPKWKKAVQTIQFCRRFFRKHLLLKLYQACRLGYRQSCICAQASLEGKQGRGDSCDLLLLEKVFGAVGLEMNGEIHNGSNGYYIAVWSKSSS